MNFSINVAIPDSLLMEEDNLRDKTVKIGIIARALAIYKVKRVYIFRDPKEEKPEGELIREILNFIVTPQYLRRRLFAIKPHLKYAGTLPPLKIPSHKKERRLVEGEYREGIVEKEKDGLRVFVGVDEKPRFIGNASSGKRVTVRIQREKVSDDFVAIQVSRKDIQEYWGYTVHEESSIMQLCRSSKLCIATSRLGTPIQDVWIKLCNDIKRSGECLIFFGAPKRGLFDIFSPKELESSAKYILNTIPGQGVETVRTEEALLATLQTISLAQRLQLS